MWHIDCSNTKTCKSENLICIGWDGGNHEARVKAFLVLREAGTHDRCISQSSICIVTSCKTMLIYPVTKCMYCCYDPTTQSNGLGPIWYLQPKLGFRRNSFMSQLTKFATILGSQSNGTPAPLAWHVSCEGQLTKFTRNNPGDSQSFNANLSPASQRVSPARTDLSLVEYLSQIHMSILDFNEKILFQAPVKNCGNSPQSALDDHQNHSQNIINSVRGESGKQENSPVPVFPQLLCTPRTSAWPPPTCPASPRERLSCSPR